MVTNRDRVIAHAFQELGRACEVLAAALLLGSYDAEARTAPVEASPAVKPEPKARAPKQKPLNLLANDDAAPEGLTKTQRKILVALAQLGRPVKMAQVGLFTGLSHTAGGFTQAVADLRRDGLAEGPGAALEITPAGRVELGEFAPLPTGHALFEFWCSKLGTTAEKILRALKQARQPLSASDLGDTTNLSHTAGGFTQALADLRRMDLITGNGKSMTLSPDFKRALEPTIGIFDTGSGRQVRVDVKGNARS